MKLKKYLLLFVFQFCFIYADPLLVVVLMVKNEATVIVDTLEPFVKGGVKDYIIFDTGSCDGTQEIVKEFFKEHGITNGHVVEEPFINFAESRNHALDAAQTIFPDATFMVMPDAEWYIHNAAGLLQFCEEHKNDFHNSYTITAASTTQAFGVTRLIRCRRNIRFVGAVHETLNQLTFVTLPQDVYFEWAPRAIGMEKSAQRWHRDRDLLLKEHEKDPSNDRTLFYLGQTYDCLGDWENAYTFYKKRAAIQGWDQENFIIQLRMGNVARQLALQESPDALCPLAVQHYLKAYSMRPQRAESLVALAQYYLGKHEMYLAFLFASRAVQVPYPVNDVLFIEKYQYDFVRYDILGICAWYVGEYEIGEWAVRKALEVQPAAWHLNFNLKLYVERKSAIKT
ncbi:MAG TPA: glycosyltransferase family 2 protein [Candidatus Babeliales bacterium]|nr:glycosyltransferase family 2 protein [Candidatus Babeliales bacterium]